MACPNRAKPFFMDINWIKMQNPTNAAPDFRGRSHRGDYSDSLMEMDADIGRVLDEIRADAPNTIVILTADNGAWLDGYPDAGTTPFRGENGSVFEGGWRVPAIMTWPGHIPAGANYGEMMSHIDCWSTLAAMAGIPVPPTGEMKDNNGKPTTSTASSTAPIFWANHHTPHTDRGSLSTASISMRYAPTSAEIPRSHG
jgi:arylsulfatase A-like enzyme